MKGEKIMARANLSDVGKYTGGGGSFFKLEDGEKKSVRFLYNTVQEVMASALTVHEFTGDKFATIDCARLSSEDPVDACKWCAGGNNPVMRVVLPMYDEVSGEIQYWKKSGSWVTDVLVPLFENLPAGVPISGQSFVISRTGKTFKDTKYQVAPDMKNPNDNKTKDQFGEVKDPFDINIIKPNDYDFDPNGTVTNNASQGPAQQATRRTADIF